jgi:hypothetical protein
MQSGGQTNSKPTVKAPTGNLPLRPSLPSPKKSPSHELIIILVFSFSVHNKKGDFFSLKKNLGYFFHNIRLNQRKASLNTLSFSQREKWPKETRGNRPGLAWLLLTI